MLQFDIKRILYNPIGRILLSMLLGIGLASLFNRVCKEKDCIHFHGPVIKEIDQKTFEFDNKCYQYEAVPVKCDENKKIIEFASTKQREEFKSVNVASHSRETFRTRSRDQFGASFT